VSKDTPKPSAKARIKRHRIGLFAPTLVALVAIAGWSGYWFYNRYLVIKTVTTQVQNLKKAGYTVRFDPFYVKGYPYRMFVEWKNLTVIAPSGRGFSTTRLDAEANAYALDKWVIVAPETVTIYRGHPNGVDLGTVTVNGKVMRASVSHLGKPIYNIALQGVGLTLTPSDPTHPFVFVSADNFEAYLRPTKDVADSADMLVRLSGAKGAPRSLVGDLSPWKPLNLHLEGTVGHVSGFKGKDFNESIKAWSATGGQITGVKSELVAGDLNLFMHADALTVDKDRHAKGQLAIEMTGTFKPLEVLGALHVISEENMSLAKPLIDMTLATQGTQKFAIDFKNGGAYIGALKVSNAPILP